MSWRHIRGHDALIEAFGNVLRRGRLAHAYLLVGPPGVGKRLFAEELAKALLCEGRKPDRFEACDTCPGCRQVAALAHPDFYVACRPEESLELPIETIRELCASFSLKAARGGAKVAILDNADDLNTAAANCFLKTLEEPPPRSVLFLIGVSAERQLPTIVSRCQVVPFAPLRPELVAELLHAQGIEESALAGRLAQMSGGSPGEAIALAEPTLWEFRKTLLQRLATSPVDTVALARAWIEFVEEAGKESALQRRRAALVVRLLIDFLEAALRQSVGEAALVADPEDLRALAVLGKGVSIDDLLAMLDRCLEAALQIDRRVQLVLVIEALVDALGQALK